MKSKNNQLPERIASFKVNHLLLEKGLYLSRKDANISTVDLRMRAPYKDCLLGGAEMHSLEHTLATKLRNGANKEDVIYVGPMGCRTGFYCLFKDMTEMQIVEELKNAFLFLATAEYEMPGNTKSECGNCTELSVTLSKNLAKEYYEIVKNKKVFDNYPN